MRLLAVIVVVLMMLSCHSRNSTSVSLLGEYDMPLQRAITEKIYTYRTDPGSDTVVYHFKFSWHGDTCFMKEQFFTAFTMANEREYRITGSRKTLLKEYRYESDGPINNKNERVEGKIASFKEIDEGLRFSSLKCVIVFTNSLGFKTVMKEYDRFKGDATFVWNETAVDAIKFSFKTSSTTYIKYLPFIRESEESEGDTYYAKGIGFCRFVSDDYELNLVSIEEIP